MGIISVMGTQLDRLIDVRVWEPVRRWKGKSFSIKMTCLMSKFCMLTGQGSSRHFELVNNQQKCKGWILDVVYEVNKV